MGRGDHPTADQLYETVRAELPGISRMTVYRVLDLLVLLGLVQRVSHPGVAVRFDPNPRPHHHLICLGCQRLIDVEERILDELEPPAAAGRLGFAVTDHSVQFRGLCAQCRCTDAESGEEAGPCRDADSGAHADSGAGAEP
jgi:Fur family transcriptional regulator, peroxide stress response regulator